MEKIIIIKITIFAKQTTTFYKYKKIVKKHFINSLQCYQIR